MTIHLADKTVTHPRGICEDLLIKVDKLVFPADFMVLYTEEDHEVPIILGRPFLNTACAIVDVRESKLTLRVGDDLQFTFPLEEEFDGQIDLMESEKLLEESEVNRDLSSFEETNSSCLDKNLQYDEANQDDKKESLEEENTKAWNNNKHNSSIGLHMIDQKVKETKPTTIKRTKPRALVSTTFKVLIFKPPDSQEYEESEIEFVTSSDDEGMSEREIEIDKIEVKKMGQQKEEENTRPVKRGKGKKRKYDENTPNKTIEDMKRVYIKKVLAYKRRWNVKKVKKELSSEKAAAT
uniref:Reverse transcriptase domain-containing protein n=1 Tax=Lactuca sativa TaxID=4236 RepID=A0A9R1VNH5_LACSA|nr:hypothetical protein LSAT_V11C500241780 [Lactuca sativa]